MMKRLLALLTFSLGLLIVSPALAQNCASYPFTLTNGTTADANQVMSNFNAIRNCVNATVVSNPVPVSQGGTGATTQLLAEMAVAGGSAVGVDWRISLDDAWTVVGEERGIQGNLEPAVLLGPWERAEWAALDVLRRAGGRPGHVFNLGHGVLPETAPGILEQVVTLVHVGS